MIKRVFMLLVPLGALAAFVVALAPVAPAGADTVCPPGMSPPYCTKKCKVPDVRGETVKQARVDLKDHDCRLGHIHHHQLKHNSFHHHHYAHGTIYKQNLKPGHVYKKDKTVNVWVNEKPSKHHHHHHHKK